MPSTSRLGRTLVSRLPGPHDDQVGFEDGADRLRVGLDVGGLEEDLLDARAALGDVGLAADHLVVLGAGVQGDVGQGRGQDQAAHGEDAAGLAHGLFEVAGDAGHRDDEQVAEAVTFQAGAFVEAVLEQARHQRLGLGQRGDAVAHVARRQHAELAAQAAGGAAVVADGDDRGQVARVLLEAAQQDRQAGAAADGDDLGAARLVAVAVDRVDEAVVVARDGRRRRAATCSASRRRTR